MLLIFHLEHHVVLPWASDRHVECGQSAVRTPFIHLVSLDSLQWQLN